MSWNASDLFTLFRRWQAEDPSRDLVCLVLFADGSGRVCRESPYKSYAVWDKSATPGDLSQAVAAIQAITRRGVQRERLRVSIREMIERGE